MHRIAYRLTILLGLLVGLLLIAPAAHANIGKVLLGCAVDQTAVSVDPIKGYGFNPFGHKHTNIGSTAFDASTTIPRMLSSPTTCNVKSDRSAIWFPTPLKADGTPATIQGVKYYLMGPLGRGIDSDPQGLKFIAGSPGCTSTPCSAASYYCIKPTGGFVFTGHYIPSASVCNTSNTSTIQMIMFSNQCWNGVDYGPGMGGTGGPADGSSHLTYNATCAAGLFVPVVQLIVSMGVDVAGGRLASDLGTPGASGHFDYAFGWGRNSSGDLALPKVIDQCHNSPLAQAVTSGSSCQEIGATIRQNYGVYSTVTD